MKTSWKRLKDVFRLRLQDIFKTNIFALVICLQKTSSRRLQYVLIKTNIFVLAIHLQDVFKTSSRHLQDILPRRLQDAFKRSSRCPQKRLQDIFKTSCKDAFKMFWRCIIRLNCLPSSRICLGHTSEKFMVNVENLQVWYILAYLHDFSFSLYYIF